MIIPQKIKVGAHEYKIVLDDVDGDSDNRMGHCYTRKLQIYIDPNISQSQKEETLIHEVMHAICDQVHAFPFTDNGREDEERIVQSLGHGLYSFLKENNLLS